MLCRLSSKLFLLMLVVPNMASAWQASENVSVHGFVNQGVVKTDHNQYLGQSEKVSTSPFEVGLNAYWEASQHISFAAQTVWQRFSNKVDSSVELDYVFGRYEFELYDALNSYIELGRVKVDYGLFNAVRDVPFARPPGLHAPNSVYLLRGRDLMLSIDGINTAFEFEAENATSKLTMYSGITNSDQTFFEEYLFKNNLDSDFEHYRKTGASLFAELHTHYPVTLGVSYMGMNTRLEGGLSTMDLTLDSFLYSLKLELDSVTLIAEKSDTFSKAGNTNLPVLDPVILAGLEANNLPTYISEDDERIRKTTAYYLSGEYAINDDFSWFVRYEEQDLLQKESDIEAFLNLGYITDSSQIYTHAWFTGVSWFCREDLLINLEYGLMSGTSYLNSADNPDFSEVKEHWRMLGLSIAYQF